MTLSLTTSQQHQRHKVCLYQICLFMLLCLCSLPALARNNSIGVGAQFAQPHGLSVQLPINRWTAFNSSLYYDVRIPTINIHLDQIFFRGSIFYRNLYPYVGYGALMNLHPQSLLTDQGALIARAPFGLELGQQFRAFVELTPSLSVLPALTFKLHSSLGLRFHF